MSREPQIASMERLATEIATLLGAVEDVERWSGVQIVLPFVAVAAEKANDLHRQLSLMHTRVCENRYVPLNDFYEDRARRFKA